MVLTNKKKCKILRNSDVGVGEGEDKISKLPDALIHHILSFVPAECVMSTFILSKRWKYLSSSNPTLDFSWRRVLNCTAGEKYLRTQQFMNFLDMVLNLHEKLKIQKFCLNWDFDETFDGSRVNRWIDIVIKRKVEELILTAGSSFLFPLSFFTCESLTVLVLDSVELDVPDTVCFTRLKLLRLRYMHVSGRSIKKLVSNSPILEELSLIHCLDLEPSVFSITSISLKKLRMHEWLNFKSSILKISAPNLSTISYRPRVLANLWIDSFPSLIEADIDMSQVLENTGRDLGDRAFVLIKLFGKLSNIKLLKMSFSCFLVATEADILLLPAFNNLIHLEVRSQFYLSGYGSDSISIMRRFFKFLQLLPNLESIVFALGIHFPEEEDDGCWSSLDPKCLPPHLKSIIFRCFLGEPGDLNAIKFLLKYVGFLETITVEAHHTLSENHEELINAKKLLLMIPRPAKCVIKFLTSSENA